MQTNFRETVMSDSTYKNPQAERFLAILNTMSPNSRETFYRIYELAPKTREQSGTIFSGPHVRLAMVEALVQPEIAYWVRMNLAIRVARKFAQTAGLIEKANRFSQLLEDFHIATDAFIHHIPVSLAAVRRRKAATLHHEKNPHVSDLTPLETSVAAEQVAAIQAFKQQIIPGFVQAIRRNYIKTA
jgi:hypothetical protein